MTEIPTELAHVTGFGSSFREVRSGGLPVRYLRSVSGGTTSLPVVMIHGGGGLLGELDEAHTLLAKQYDVVALEMPGWGPTANTVTRDLREMAGLLAASVATLGIRRYRLIGTSIGAAVALWWTIDHPDVVERAVLEAPSAFRSGVPELSGPPDPAVFNLRPDKQRPRAPHPGARELMMTMAPRGVDEPGIAEALRDLDTPVLAVFGAADRMFPPAEFAGRYKVAPHGAVTIIDNAAHDTKGDQPEAFAKVVADFFDGRPVESHIAAPGVSDDQS